MTGNIPKNQITVVPNALCGSVRAVASKSFAHRMLIAAALFSDKEVEINGITLSEDVLATADCLRALGAEINFGQTTVVVPIKSLPSKAVLPCRESGSTLRFFIPIVAALGVEGKFSGSDRLFARPNDALLTAIKESGVCMQEKTVCGRLLPGVYQIDASVSSQYITGLLFALALVDGDSELRLQGESVSANYVDITLSVLKEFGVQITKTETGYCIKGNNRNAFTPRRLLTVEGDWSNASFFIAAGVLGGDVIIENLNPNSLQGDRIIVPLLKEMGANVAWEKGLLYVKQSSLHGISINAEHFPDLVPILAVIAAYSNGKTDISGVSRLTIKESDRLLGIITTLRAAAIRCETDGKTLTVWGGVPYGGVFSSENDHRMAMSQTILATYAKGESIVCGANAVQKSYPHFFDDYKHLGGKFYGDVEGK